MTSKWPTVSLGEVANLIGGGTPSKANTTYWSGDIPWASVRDMKERWLSSTEFSITDSGVRESATNVIPAGNVVIATRVGLGKVVQLEKSTAINQDLRAIVPKSESTLDPAFIYYWYQTVVSEVISAGTGATVQGVKIPTIASLQIPLPPLDEQKRIVAKLDEAMDCVDEVRVVSKSIVNLQLDYLNSLFHENFSRSQELPVTTLAQVCQIRTGKKDVNQGNKDGEYPFFSCAKIPSRSDEYSFDTEAILLAGNGVNIGQAVYYNGKFEVYQRTYVLSDFQGIDVHYLSTILDFRLRTYLRELSMGNTIPYIKMGMLQDFPIPLPSLDDQKIIVKKLTSTFNELDRLKTNVETRQTIYKQLISGMLSSAFAGQL